MEGYRREKVWDPLTRVWHWALVVSVTGGWLLGEFRTFSVMQWHMYAGYCTGVLLFLRLIRGFSGPPAIRFRQLFPSPSAVMGYLRHIAVRAPSGVAGHNPLGALSVLVLLVLLCMQVTTGLFSEDDGLFFEGPLVWMASSKAVLKMTSLHHLGATLILCFVALHVGAILFYLVWKRENLVTPMLNGWKWVRSNGARSSSG